MHVYRANGANPFIERRCEPDVQRCEMTPACTLLTGTQLGLSPLNKIVSHIVKHLGLKGAPGVWVSARAYTCGWGVGEKFVFFWYQK